MGALGEEELKWTMVIVTRMYSHFSSSSYYYYF